MRACEAEAESGRLEIAVPKSLKDKMAPTQRIWVPLVREMAEKVCVCSSFRDGTELLNAFLHRDGEESSFKVMSMHDIVRQDGSMIEEAEQKYIEKVFSESGWLGPDGTVPDISLVPESIRNPSVPDESREAVRKKAEEAAAAFNEGKEEDCLINASGIDEAIGLHPRDMVIVSVDTIVFPFQKEHRNVNGATGNVRDKKRVGLANGVVMCAEGTYRFVAASEEDALKKILAFLVDNRLLENRGLAFFMDGAVRLKELVHGYFGFRDYDYHLDWYHLWKKCYEYFSMALYGGKENKERNNRIRYEFFKRLWAGNNDEAAAYLETLKAGPGKIVKSEKMLEAIKDYITKKKKDDIYSYALRKELGLINSSNQVEKQNDIVVADRCKDCSSSWGKNGSLHIAHIVLVLYQRQEEDWYYSHEISFRPIGLSETLKQKMWLA